MSEGKTWRSPEISRISNVGAGRLAPRDAGSTVADCRPSGNTSKWTRSPVISVTSYDCGAGPVPGSGTTGAALKLTGPGSVAAAAEPIPVRSTTASVAASVAGTNRSLIAPPSLHGY